jgi:hypothetical protein
MSNTPAFPSRPICWSVMMGWRAPSDLFVELSMLQALTAPVVVKECDR